MYDQIKKIVTNSGLWDDGRIDSHRFLLSPSVYLISQEKKDALEKLGAAMHDCLSGLGRIAAIAHNPLLAHGTTWRTIVRVLRTGVPSIYRDIMLLNPGSVPGICKVDLMESDDGNLRIAEIDGHNKHGLGYSALTAEIRKTIAPEASVFPGVAASIAREMKRREKTRAVLLYADQERFYLPEFRILQSALATAGTELLILGEKDARIQNGRLAGVEKNGEQTFFVDFPFFYHNCGLNAHLAGRYSESEIDFLIPPKPFLGSKAVLALLRNDSDDTELEAILRSQIPFASLGLLRQYVPITYLVHKKVKAECWQYLCAGSRFVLKESISSGMKGTIFADDPHFNIALREASRSHYRFVLQEEIANRAQAFEYFAEDGSLLRGRWFARITVHYALRRVADIVVTARQDKKVHGAPDCLQLGTIIA